MSQTPYNDKINMKNTFQNEMIWSSYFIYFANQYLEMSEIVNRAALNPNIVNEALFIGRICGRIRQFT